LVLASCGTRHSFQVSEAFRIAQARRCGHGGRDGWFERKIVRQFEQVGNRQGERDIAIKRDVLVLAATHLFTPLASQSVLIKDHG
jgi:hypothetical protein